MFIDYIEAELGEAEWNSRGVEASWDCPFCTMRGETQDTRKRFGFNESKLVGNCFNCGWKGNAVTFVKDIRGIGWREAIDTVNVYVDYRPLPTNVFDEVYSGLYLEGFSVEEVKSPPKLPEDYRVIVDSRSIVKDRYINYAKSRGVSHSQLETYLMGYCMEGETEFSSGKKIKLNNHLFILNPTDRGVTYWMARALNPTAKPKTFNPPSSNTILGKSDVVFNLDYAKKTGVVVITEGVFDALTVGQSGVALFGKMMSTSQYLDLINCGVDTMYVMLDGDARSYALEICERLNRVIDNVYFCEMGNSDPNDLGPEGCLRVLTQAQRYSPLTSIKLKLAGGN